MSLSELLKKTGLRDTKPRRLVLQALSSIGSPCSPKDVEQWITNNDGDVNLVTVYRVIESLREHRLVHRHPSTGLFVICSLPGTQGHHGFLHCHSCGKVEEFHNDALCRIEDEIASSAGFKPAAHLSEISGICSLCH